MSILDRAKREGRTLLTEYDAKRLLSDYGIPVTRERLVTDERALHDAARDLGYPIVLKGCSEDIAHKTEQGLIQLNVRDDEEAVEAFRKIMAGLVGKKGGVLVQEMVRGSRELVVGLIRDPQFGPCVMFGLGGIFTEILEDVAFRVAPLKKRDALEMMQEIRGHKILGSVRGMPPADPDLLADILINVGRMGMDHGDIKEIDINPIILSDSGPVAVDCLIALEG